MKSKIIALVIAFAFLFAGLSVSFAQDKNIKKDVKRKTETVKHDVKKKTEEGMKNQTQTGMKKDEKTKENLITHKKHKVSGEKTKQKETNSKTK